MKSPFAFTRTLSAASRGASLQWASLGLSILALAACSSEKKENETAHREAPAASESAASPEVLAAGKAVYETNCASCHGPNGMGDGPAAAALDPKPRNFTDKEYMQHRDRATLRKVIVEGGASVGLSPMMVAWGSILKPEDIDPVLEYVLSLSK